PDLLGARMPAEELASMLYDTVENKLKTLPDATRVYPAHGAGSACGKHIGDAEYTTIGDEKAGNEAMRAKDRASFIRLVTSDLPDAPGYFSEDAELNLEGMRPLTDVIGEMRGLTLKEVQAEMSRDALVLDTRGPDAFSRGSLPGAVSISLDGQFAPWVGTLIKRDTPLVLLCEEGREEEAAIRCGRIGYENIRGYLQGGFEAWESQELPVAKYGRLKPGDLGGGPIAGRILLDVRNPSERKAGYIPGSLFIPLNRLTGRMRELAAGPVDVYCGSGYRSAMAVSLLRKAGRKGVRDLEGGFDAYRKSGLPVKEDKDV